MDAAVERRRLAAVGHLGSAWRPLAWAWLVGMATWTVIIVLDSLGITPEIFGMRGNALGVLFALPFIGSVQAVLMIPGAAAYWVWRSAAPGWSLRAPLPLLTGAAIGAGTMYAWGSVLGTWDEPVMIAVAAIIGATTFVIDGLARSSGER